MVTINIEQSNIAKRIVARNIHVSFTNKLLLHADVMVFVFYSELTIDTDAGIVGK